MHAQYFDHRTGRQLTEEEALGPNGMRDGVVCRTRMLMRDGVRHRPGFASSGTSFTDWEGRDAKREAYNDYIRDLETAYKRPARAADVMIDEDDGDDDEISAADAKTSSSDRRRGVADMAADHRRNMERVYRDHAAMLEQEWRRKG